MVFTSKDFIGKINGSQFEVISNSFIPYGALCVIKGELSSKGQTQVKLSTSLHKAIRILFAVWAVFAIGAGVMLLFTSDQQVHIGPIIVLPFAIAFFRLFWHGMYVLARNNAVNKLKGLLLLSE